MPAAPEADRSEARLPTRAEIVALAETLERRARRLAPPPALRSLLVASRAGLCVVPLRGSVEVGRGRACAVSLSSARVSRRHATVTARGGELVVRDLGSRNGTYARGERVDVRAVAQGEEVRFADEPVRFWIR